MNNKLTREEVLHVAHLARINISEEEIELYQMNLKQMIDEIDKIRSIDNDLAEEMFTPALEETKEEKAVVPHDDLLKNVPKTKGNFIEVPVMINE